MMEKPIRVGVVGSGLISGIYLKNMIGRFDVLEVAGLYSSHYENAKKRADEYGVAAYESLDALLADGEAEIRRRFRRDR